MNRVQPTETEFVQMLHSGNAEQFARVYDSYSMAIFGVIRRIITDREQAEDVLQDTFIKIWEKRELYDPSKGSIYTWMLNIARNTSIDFTRSKHFKAAAKIRNIDDNVGNVNRSTSSSTNTDVIGVSEVLRELPDEQRQIIDLMYFNGMSQDEISKEYNIPLGTVKTRTRSAMMKLKNIFMPQQAT
ncbi:MAG: RNA polymerase sigma factor [Flavobacteriales bacterium]